MANTPKFNIRKPGPEERPRIDIDFNAAIDRIEQSSVDMRQGLDSARPTSGIAQGVYYYSTDTETLRRYNGSSWVIIHPAPEGSVGQSSINPAWRMSTRVFDFRSSLVWNSLSSLLRGGWTAVAGTPPQWAVDYMGMVHFRGAVQRVFPTGGGGPAPPTPMPGPMNDTIFEFKSTHPSSLGPPPPYSLGTLRLEVQMNRRETKLLSSKFVTEASPGNPSRIVEGIMATPNVDLQLIELSALRYSL